jgi:hypothetical protein
MALTVNTNVTSLNVQKNLNRASDALSTSMTRLSSGLKINSAKDDAAGLQIATRMTSQIRGQTMAIKTPTTVSRSLRPLKARCKNRPTFCSVCVNWLFKHETTPTVLMTVPL